MYFCKAQQNLTSKNTKNTATPCLLYLFCLVGFHFTKLNFSPNHNFVKIKQKDLMFFILFVFYFLKNINTIDNFTRFYIRYRRCCPVFFARQKKRQAKSKKVCFLFDKNIRKNHIFHKIKNKHEHFTK